MANTHVRPQCHCGAFTICLDANRYSETRACPACAHCYLSIQNLAIQVWIPLRDFHLKRGVGSEKRPIDDLRMATRLVDCLLNDQWPSMATMVDFGIDSPAHYGALQCAVLAGITAYELDRVMGDGPAITRLIRSVPGQAYGAVQFFTAYDALSWGEAEEEAI